MTWVPDLQRSVVLEVTVEAEVEFKDDYPFGGDVLSRMAHEDGLNRLADRVIAALVNVEGVTGVWTGWSTRYGGSYSRGAGLEPDE